MSATDELRRMLDERGVEHFDYDGETLWGIHDETIYDYAAWELQVGGLEVQICQCEPAVAIAATLGPHTCHMAERKEPQSRGWFIHYWECDECGEHYRDKFAPRYCPGCGARVVDA